jgi:hypothetical protein
MKTVMALLLLALATFGAAEVRAAETSTLRVVVVDTKDLKAYLATLGEVKRLTATVTPKMVVRAWQATYAGPDAGAVIVSVEYPGSMSKFATAWETMMANAQIAQKMAELGNLRRIVGDSLYQELAL